MEGKEIRILTLLALDTAFFFLEIIIGYAVNSLALIADAFHMLNDIFSLVVAYWAVKVAKSRGVDSKYTYGWQRAEILGALINAVFLIALCMTIFLEAIQRFIEVPEVTNPKLILIVGSAGLASNIIGLFLFHEHGHSHGGGSIGDEESHGHGHENGHSHGHSHGNSHSHSHSIDESYQRSLVDDSAPISDAFPSNYVSKISESTSLLNKKQPRYNSVDTDSTINKPDDDDDDDSIDSAHDSPESYEVGSSRTRQHKRSHSVSSVTHKDHFHVKPRDSVKQKSMNMEGVFLHVMGDALGNVGVIFTALFIWKTDYSWKYYMDPAISLIITAIIFSSALPLCRRTSAILLQAVPQSVDADQVRADIVSLPGVIEIHDLHIWNLSETLNVATLHVSVSDGPSEFSKLTKRIRTCMRGHGIDSTTIQPEFSADGNVSSDEMPECILQGNKSSGGLSSAS